MRAFLSVWLLALVACATLAGAVSAAPTAAMVPFTTAPLSGSADFPTAHGHAKFRDAAVRELAVEVANVLLPAGTELEVLIDGTAVGSVTLDAFGGGALRLDAALGDAVPPVTSGTTVVVQTADATPVLSGSF